MLLYDGEELVGAKQNRILNVSVLVGAGAKLPIPVSCVEQGRWARSSVDFDSATHISHAHLRRRKAEMLSAQPLARGVAQSEVWAEIGEKQQRMSVSSPTGAARDTFVAHGDRLQELEDAFPLQPGQCGAVLAIGSDLCLDAVSRPGAFALLWPKLRAGLPARRARAARPSSRPASEQIAGFVDEVADAVVSHGPSAGLGSDVRLRGPGVVGSGLELDGERIQLSAFTSDGGGSRAFGRIARPSRRR